MSPRDFNSVIYGGNGIRMTFLHVGDKFRVLYSNRPYASLYQCLVRDHPDWLSEEEFRKYWDDFLLLTSTEDHVKAAAAAQTILKRDVCASVTKMGRRRDLNFILSELPIDDFLESFDSIISSAREIELRAPNLRVVAHGLQGAKHLNGKIGDVRPAKPKSSERNPDGTSKRLAVVFDGDDKVYALKPENLKIKSEAYDEYNRTMYPAYN